MRKSILFSLTLLTVVSMASAAQAGLFSRRGGGCPNGQCGVSYSAQAYGETEVADAAPVEAAVAEAAEPGEEVVADVSGDYQPRRFRLFRGR